ncbi:hypothetical protein M433DRAFT_143089 [Acidomyces richmondensis BFW]|nr:MAG: hypothetical protein FE78DRAFT_78311 [Acidomyces sp. 'richmondensis']KYG46302.1 hypothetical protein M433DRAFT_143089 [Acidomyces richmondensis BFW]
MALSASAAVHLNGGTETWPAEDEELFTQLLQLQNVVIEGNHPVFKLPPSSIENLKSGSLDHGAHPDSSEGAANQQQTLQSTHVSNLGSGYGSRPANGLNPIFLEKADSLVRAEGQLKRQRIERDLQAQVDQRKHTSRTADLGFDGPSRIDVDAVLKAALIQVTPLSGLKPGKGASVDSFDENDYYSSQAPDVWSSDASSSEGSDKSVGAFTADYERLDGAVPRTDANSSHVLKSATSMKRRDLTAEDEDEEYTPPDATAFDSFRDNFGNENAQSVTPPEDDDSDYEPGEITQDSTMATPYQDPQHASQPSPRVPVIRNHLTHIAAPQPNRVSPLATAKGPSIELELVNGRPEIVPKAKPQQRPYPYLSRASTASPSGNGISGSNKKLKNKKKRKQRDQERNDKPAKKGKHRKQATAESLMQREPYIKDEPISPPSFSANVPEYVPAPQYRPAPAHVDLLSPSRPNQHVQYVPESSTSNLRYESTPAPLVPTRVASPAQYRPVQRDTQDLRRVASLHYAQRPPSPSQQYSPAAPYRASLAFGGSRHEIPPPAPEPPEPTPHHYMPADGQVQYLRPDRAPSPPRTRQFEDGYSRPQTPAMMAPPPPRSIIMDQYGNRYYAATEPVFSSRASAAPVERRADAAYERVPSNAAYLQTPLSVAQYEPIDSRAAAPAGPIRRQEAVHYVDSNSYPLRDYSMRPSNPPARYLEEPAPPQPYQAPPPRPPQARESTSPVYEHVPRYEAAFQPQLARDAAASPVYQPRPRPYSVRPDDAAPPAQAYMRQASVAPIQYVRHDMAPPPPPPRAVSVMPAGIGGVADPGAQYQYAGPAPPPPGGAGVKYVDRYGREVYAQDVRPVYQ